MITKEYAHVSVQKLGKRGKPVGRPINGVLRFNVNENFKPGDFRLSVQKKELRFVKNETEDFTVFGGEYGLYKDHARYQVTKKIDWLKNRKKNELRDKQEKLGFEMNRDRIRNLSYYNTIVDWFKKNHDVDLTECPEDVEMIYKGEETYIRLFSANLGNCYNAYTALMVNLDLTKPGPRFGNGGFSHTSVFDPMFNVHKITYTVDSSG